MIDPLLGDPSPDDAAKKARIKRNFDKMRAAGAKDDELESYLRDVEHLTPGPPAGAEKLHADFRSGALQRRTARQNINDQEQAAVPEPGYLERAATHVLNAGQGIPGVEAVEAGAGALGSQLTSRPMGYRQSLNTLRGATGQIGGKTSAFEHVLGSAPLIPFLPASVVRGGAALGAADQALAADADRGVGERIGRGVVGGVVGAATGGVLRGAGNVAQRIGLTDAIASRASTLGGKAIAAAEAIRARGGGRLSNAVASGVATAGTGAQAVGNAMGTTGAANRLMTDRQKVLDELSGSEQTAAQTMLDHVQHYKQQAGTLYDAAKQDQAVVNDPRVTRVLNDQRFRQILDVVRERLGLTPNPTQVRPAIPGRAAIPSVPRSESLALPRAPTEVPSGFGPLGTANAPASTREAIDAFQRRAGAAASRTEGTVEQQAARAALERRGAEASLPAAPPSVVPAKLNEPRRALPMIPDKPAEYADLPTPEELAMAKRLASQVVQQKFNAPQGISAAEAAQMAPLLDDLRAALHEASPAWKQADAFWSHAKSFELAYNKAFNAQQKTTAAGLDPSKLKTPEAVNAWVNKAKGTPVGIARASGQQAGAAGRLNEAVRGAPLGTDIGETLRGANGVFQPSVAAAAIRRPAFGSDADATAFTGTLASLMKKGAKESASFGPQTVKPSINPLTLFGAGKALTKQNPLATPEGIGMRMKLADYFSNPSNADAIRATLASAKHGQSLIEMLRKAGLLGANAGISP